MNYDRSPTQWARRQPTARRSRARLLVTLFGVAAFMFCVSPAWGFPSARLEYARGPGAESCPDETALRQAVADRLGYDPFDPSAAELLRAQVIASAGRFSALLELITASSNVRARRTLDSVDNCAELVAALALSMSIAIDPERSAQGETSGAVVPEQPSDAQAAPSEKQRPPPTETKPKPRAPAPVALVTSSSTGGQSLTVVTSRTFRLRVGASGHLSFGAEPAPAPGAELGVGIRRGAWSLTLLGRYDAETSESLKLRGAVHARLRAAALLPCFHLRPALFCGNVTLGRLVARTTGLTAGRTDSALFAAAGARVGVEWPVAGWFALQGFGQLLVTARSLSGEVNEAAVWEMPLVTGLLGAGFIAEF